MIDISSVIVSPLRYPGGKSRVVNRILDFFPVDFMEYREPFVGGGSVFLKTLTNFNNKIIKINDINQDLYLFWKVLKYDALKFYNDIKKIKIKNEIGKDLFEYYKQDRVRTEYEKAIRFYILNRITFSGLTDSGGYSEQSYKYRFTDTIIDRLKNFHGLLDKIHISCHDYKRLLHEDGDNILIYLDPPYINNKQSKLYGIWGNLHKYFNHNDFFKELKQCKHKWILTIDNTEAVLEAFKNTRKYNLHSLEIQYGMDNAKGNEPKKATELIVTNFLPFKFMLES